MTRENLKKLTSSVKCTFAKLMSLNGYSKGLLKEADDLDLLVAYQFIMGDNFKFGAAYENIRLLEKENEKGIATLEADGLSYRSFITLEDDSSRVCRSVYVKPGEMKDESYISTRFFSEDQSLIVINAKTKGKGNEVQALCSYIYDSETIDRYIELNPNFNPAEIGEDVESCMTPSRILMLFPSTGVKDITLLQRYLDRCSKASEILTLSALDEKKGQIPFEIFMSAAVLINTFDKGKTK